MRTSGIAVAFLAAIGLSAGNGYAQQTGDTRKPATQTQDQGVDDSRTPPGQSRKEPGPRVVTQVPVTVHTNGVAVAELDESFDEALVVHIAPDGTRATVEVQGTARAEELVRTGLTPTQTAAPLEEK